MDCLFCKIIAGGIPCTKVYEDSETMAFLDIHPINPGHTLVVPKKHVESFAKATPDMFPALFSSVQKVAVAALAATGAQAYNIGLNTGEDAGQTVMHLHIHVMPRFVGDGHVHWGKKDVAPEEMQRVAGEMREQLKV